MSDPFEGDKLNRKPDAELLTQLIVNEPRPRVVSVDAPWGGGKTTFVSMWGRYLASLGHPVISYNAWETDFVEDPLIGFIGEIEEDLLGLSDLTSTNPRINRYWRRLKGLGATVIRSTGPLALRVASQGLLNVSDVEKALSFVSNSESDISDYVARVTESRLASYATEKQAAASFRDTLSKLASELTSQPGARPPLIIIVDELDRCRPSFAIGLLERMKHLFAVEGVVFILALDKAQLAHTVRALYGAGFAAEGYLRRFIDFDYRLPMPTGKAFAEYLADRHKIIEVFRANQVSGGEYDTVVPSFAILSSMYSLSLRDQEQAFQRIVIALKSAPSARSYLYTNLMLFLGVLRFGDPAIYEKYMAGEIGVRHVIESVESRPAGSAFLNSHRGHVTLAYLLLSARRTSDARQIIEQMTFTKDVEGAPADQRKRAAGVHALLGPFQSVGATHALQAALQRLEKINQQIEILDYD